MTVEIGAGTEMTAAGTEMTVHETGMKEELIGMTGEQIWLGMTVAETEIQVTVETGMQIMGFRAQMISAPIGLILVVLLEVGAEGLIIIQGAGLVIEVDFGTGVEEEAGEGVRAFGVGVGGEVTIGDRTSSITSTTETGLGKVGIIRCYVIVTA